MRATPLESLLGEHRQSEAKGGSTSSSSHNVEVTLQIPLLPWSLAGNARGETRWRIRELVQVGIYLPRKANARGMAGYQNRLRFCLLPTNPRTVQVKTGEGVSER